MAAKPRTAAPPAGREIVISRIVAAPRDTVFTMWTDPRHVAQWWGPHGFTNPVCELDARRGGHIRINMRGPDGSVYPMTGTFQELRAPQRIAMTCAALDADNRPVLETLNTTTFEARGDRTFLTLRAKVLRATGAGHQYADGMEAGWLQSLERLAEYAMQPVATTGEREIVLTRAFEAPRDMVWRAWTDPQQIIRWWGPFGFTTTTEQMEVKPGGVWRFVMHGPDGRDYQNLITYREVSAPERLVYQHGGDQDCEPVNFVVTATFAPEGTGGTQTRVTMRMEFPSTHARDFVIREYGALEGGKQTLTRLAQHLAQVRDTRVTTDEQPFVISRVFDVTRDRMFKLWTERAHLEHWFGPKGCTLTVSRLELQPGGMLLYRMQIPGGMDHWGRWIFREIVPPERLTFVVSFADEAGNVTRAPFSADWPLEMLSTVTFAEHAGKGGGTVVTVEWSPLNASAAERRAVAAGFNSMRKGWTGTMEQLAAYLART